MTTYALVSPENIVARFATDIDPSTGTKPGWRWLPVEDTVPVADASQVLEGPIITIDEKRVTRVWSVRDKTAEEIAAEKDQRIERSEPAIVLAVLLDHENRVRALEGKAAVTLAQFKRALRSVA